MNQDNTSRNKRIAKNTFYMYIRMFVVMLISLYSSRLILKILGFSDYGVYNVVGGVVMIFTFINTSLTTSTSRFLSYAIGQGDQDKISTIFSSALFLHILLSVFVFVLSETAGLWYIDNYLNLSYERVDMAKLVFHFSVINTMFVICSVPFSSIIVANENMSVYALFSIFDAISKLGVIFLLNYIDYDKLFLYAFLQCVIAFLMFMLYGSYCLKSSLISSIKPKFSKACYGMLKFSGWTLLTSFVGAVSTQGVNLMLNAFWGTVLNAAYGITTQVKGAVQNFSTGFQVALNPQIVKSYAGGELSRHNALILASSRYSFFLLWLFVLPLSLNLERILDIWLDSYPEFTVLFTQLAMVELLFSTFSNPFGVSIEATGELKSIVCIGSSIRILFLVLTYVLFSRFNQPYLAFVLMALYSFVILIVNMMVAHSRVHFSFYALLMHSFLPIVIVIVVSVLAGYVIILLFQASVLWITFLRILLIGAITICTIYFLGLNMSERKWVRSFIRNILRPYYRYKMSDGYREKRLLKNYQKSSSEVCYHEPFVIYALDNRFEQCGLADRIRGIVSSYAYAKAQNREFRIDHQIPFKFEDFLDSNSVDWTMKLCVSYSLNESQPVVIMNNSKGERIKSLPEDKQIHFYTNVDFISVVNEWLGTHFTFDELFAELFVPNQGLKQQLEQHLNVIKRKYISISFRFVGMLGDFQDAETNVLEESAQLKMMQKCSECIDKLHQQYDDYPKILVTADSPKFLSYISSKDYVYIIPGKIGHIGYNSGKEEVLKTFIDFFMISYADKVFLGKADGMYNSNFSKLAAMSRKKEFQVIEI